MLVVPVTGQQILSSDATQRHALGTMGEDRFGRKFRYVKAGASALVVGDAIQAPAVVANHHDLTPTAAAIGSKTIAVTLGATLASENQYAGGYAIVSVTPGLGYAYPISGHASVASQGVLTANLAPGFEVQVALTATSRVILSPNPYRGVIQLPVTTATNVLVGGAVYPITAAEYGWIQSGGPGAALIAGTPTLSHFLSIPSATAGALAVNSSTLSAVAYIMDTGQDGVVCPVFWIID